MTDQSAIRLYIDTTKISLARLKDLYRHFEKKHRYQGGCAGYMLLIEAAIEAHPDNAVKQEIKPDTHPVEAK